MEEDDLPDGLILKDGIPHFECRVCGALAEFPEDVEKFDADDPHILCGGSPRCCP